MCSFIHDVTPLAPTKPKTSLMRATCVFIAAEFSKIRTKSKFMIYQGTDF